MFILTTKGEVAEGISLSPREVAVREELVKVLHEKICGSYASAHSDYDRRNHGTPQCEDIANYFVTRFTLDIRDSISLAADLKEAQDKNSPREAMPEPVPVP